jgi:ABC-2 type transport system permease protein
MLQQNGAVDPDQLNQLIDQEIQPLYAGAAQLPIQINAQSVEGEPQEFDALQYFAPSMAILFMTFAMAAGARTILEEQRTWTLQRILTTPTPRWVYMVGRLLGTFLTGVVQMLILLIATPIVAVALGRSGDLWGDNFIGLGLITVSVVAASTGLGLIFAAISKNARQADNIANAVVIIMAMLGGTFVPVEDVPVLDTLSNISLNKWGLQGFTSLAVDNATTGKIMLNVVALLAMAAAFFSIALWRFNRRLDV